MDMHLLKPQSDANERPAPLRRSGDAEEWYIQQDRVGGINVWVCD
jgi:hypothetical protein